MSQMRHARSECSRGVATEEEGREYRYKPEQTADTLPEDNMVVQTRSEETKLVRAWDSIQGNNDGKHSRRFGSSDVA